ncbi:GGDEF and EAL domain-containing protein [Lactonifactor longoviformis]|uniref:putative bifunctional diguanylate cyclase/phosphodiesterase n=1 Tax=Lactonifactor TaxID=420345 RepID=UPI001564F945|nr:MULTISPECIES: GGDEF and EAL domain-containing protein [Lactonifactor]MCB5714311.1 GGDEF and EAL domain-containing protein [Lactonifactor longoviformis]MCB5718266.1 GGDEF and EAL domain-containing protein [Lactonifactor longoviformis]MCQ4671879.1 GGDEF and EAL domain-containing protein [Lactonifactor longoviformis]
MDNWEKDTDEFVYDKEHLYDALVRSTDDYIYIGNMKTGTFRYAPGMVKDFALPGEIVPNAAAVWGELVHPHDREAFLEANQEVAEGKTQNHHVEYRAKNRKGEWVWLRCRGYMLKDESGVPDLFAGIVTNLGKKNRIDHITGIYNKFLFEEEIKTRIVTRPDDTFGVMVLGMDDFRHINDLYDRNFGDEVIRITAQKIATILPSNTGLYRMDGDEFAVLVSNVQPGDFDKIFLSIQETFHRQQQYNDKKYYCTLSGGCATYPDDGNNYQDLIKYCGYALEYAKDHGKNRMCCFSEAILNHKERDLLLVELLRESIEQEYRGFQLYYQPQVEAATGRVIGAEALARWECREFGSISPMEFIPLLEKSGLIIQAGKWIFKTAVEQCKRWSRKKRSFTVSINLSYLQILEPDFLHFVKTTVEEACLPATNIVVELTETLLVKENEKITRIFEDIQSMGFSVAMDDFGTGYSSLGVLKNTPVNIVKIDKTFVDGVEKNSFDATFIRFIVALCHDVGKEVCLEGVETAAEYEIVKGSGLEMIQGYYFGHPVSWEEFEERYLN